MRIAAHGDRCPVAKRPMSTTDYSAVTAASAAARVPAGWGDRMRRLALDVRLIAHDHAELAVVEAQRAGKALVRTLAAAVAISVLLATAWLGVVAAVVVQMTDAGVDWPVALLIGALACVLVAGIIAWWVKRNADEMMFSATLRQLRASKDTLEAER
jgi:uncharacterized membrane protein YqjE